MSDYGPTPAIIFDVDGTLTDCEHRRHFVEGENKDFTAFYEAMEEDLPVEEVIGVCNLYYHHTYQIIICTGRPERYRKITEAWLKSYGVFYHELMMRPEGREYDKDCDVKLDMLTEIRKARSVRMAFDDRQQVVDMWRKNGVFCFQVADGNF